MDIGIIVSLSSSKASMNLVKVKEIVQEIVKVYGTDQANYTVIKLVDSTVVKDGAKEAEDFKQNLPNAIRVIVSRSDGMQLVHALDDAKRVFEKVVNCWMFIIQQ